MGALLLPGERHDHHDQRAVVADERITLARFATADRFLHVSAKGVDAVRLT